MWPPSSGWTARKSAPRAARKMLVTAAARKSTQQEMHRRALGYGVPYDDAEDEEDEIHENSTSDDGEEEEEDSLDASGQECL